MRTSTKTTILGAGLAGLALLATAVPAGAADTTVTFTLPAGTISLAAAAGTPDLGTVTNAAGAATTVSGTLTELTVTDTRNLLLGGWTVSASMAGNFTGPGGASIVKGSATVNAPALGALTQGAGGVGVVTPSAASMGTGGVIATAASLLGNSEAKFTPSMTVAVPRGATPGTYTGVVTFTATGA